MKYWNLHISFLGFVLILSASCHAQRPILATPNGIDETQLEIRKQNSTVTLGESPNSVIQKFGSPDSSEPFEFEMLNKEGLLFLYGLNRFLFPDNTLVSFTINSNAFQLGLNNNYITKGQDISSVVTMFSGANSFKFDQYFKIQLVIGDQMQEGRYLMIDFNPSTNKITKIWIYQY